MKTIALVYLLIIPLLAMGDHPGMSPSIQEVKNQNASRFLSMPGVVSVGIGLADNGQEAIIVGLDGPRPATAAQIPATLEGYVVQVNIIGSIQTQ